MKTLLTVITLLFCQIIFAQQKTNWGFMKGTIFLKTGDSITGLVEKQLMYDQVLLYKNYEGGPTEEITIDKVNYFKAEKKVFETLPWYNTLMIMERLDSGKISLYTFSEIMYGKTQIDAATGKKIKKGDILIRYAIKQKGSVQEIKESNYRVLLKQVFADCERMGGKVNRGDYMFEDMPQVVKDYNNCKGQFCVHAAKNSQEAASQ